VALARDRARLGDVQQSPSQQASRGYALYVLFAMFVMYSFNYLDRYILSMLLQPIKQELGASDTMMGFLTGPAFAVLYAAAGLPIARLADRTSRRTILAIAFASWSAFTAISGFARSTAELALARVGVGIGEAGGTAPAHSLISDYFPPQARARALSVFQLGVYVGTFFGIYAGGVLAESIGWRQTFLVVGLPGLVLAVLLQLTVREPLRGHFDAASPSHATGTQKETLRALWRLPSFRWLVFGAGLASFAGTGFGAWVPTLFVRVHGMTLAEVGGSYAWYSVPAALVGTLFAGWLADRLGRRDARWLLGVAALSVLLSLPFLIGICLWPDARVAMLFAIPSGLLGAGWAPAVYAAGQNLVPSHMRATLAAVVVLSLTLLGQGAGPQVVGLLNDALAPRFGDEAVRYSLVAVLATSLAGAGMLALAARHYLRDVSALRGTSAGGSASQR
jgi:MFS family permease